MLILAHRGASDARLENTLPAFLHALERGADGVELDVQLSRDGEVVVFHDHDLVRLAGRQDRIEHLTWDELSRVQLHHNQRIIRLGDLLEVWPTDRWLNVELKAGGAAVAQKTVALLAGRPRVILSSFDPRMLLAARAAGSAYEHALLLAAQSPPFLYVGGAQAFGCAAVHLDHRLTTAAVVARYHAQGLVVGVWTVNSLLRKQEVAAWGVERIITDCP
ncbi:MULTISPECIES: glycerophosphodiester phosphodiesterase [Nannocystis]|uniref:Glycerophosphodiester phosphodiesterase n=1 Tax=Nannocystis radixulma TaxID=2995305 RepID=A0ABT5AZF0_9BACT|nr:MULTISPECIES: glycerophosphodiester phosphodiesterase [Nannocystis]MCY1054483.1 glycerophosphodiester phosphodiesterase [Nannocystis sp. SCPEA4]MDC0666608.1 glycerophosphodiester phosphodiesterase [Nannocystis radixulma]